MSHYNDHSMQARPSRRRSASLLQTLGRAIHNSCRLALRIGLGLRIPAARIHQHDLHQARQHAADQVRLALEDVSFWMAEIARIDEQRAAADAHEQALHDRRNGLRLPTPTGPIETL